MLTKQGSQNLRSVPDMDKSDYAQLQFETATADDGQNGTDAPNSGQDVLGEIGANAKNLVQAIRKLEELGITDTVPSLPKIVVVGDQSAGKSSLVEAIGNITLPRSEGTCTRCPFLVTTTHHTDTWLCEISICLKYKFVNRSNASRPLERWVDQEPTTMVFKTVRQRSDLGTALRQAQLAVLSPNRPADTFATLQDFDDAPREVKFSPNEIHLLIKAPDLLELSLYDLPGTILSLPQARDRHFADMVKELARSFIKDEQALVLLVCSADQDVHNSIAYKMVDECKAEARAIGVLTKADLATDTRCKDFLDMLDGHAFALGHGWHITKQSSQKDLDANVAHEEARRREASFFSQGVWVSSQLLQHSDCFGIPNLRRALSDRLVDAILKALPHIKDRVDSKLAQIEEQLGSFSENDDSPQLKIINEIERLSTTILTELTPASKFAPGNFRGSQYEKAFVMLSKKLLECRPDVSLVTPNYVAPAIVLDSDEDVVSEQQTPTKKRRGENGRQVSMPASTPQSTPRSKRGPSQLSNQTKATISLDDVHTRYESAPGSALSAGPSHGVTEDLAREFSHGTQMWVDRTLDYVCKLLRNKLTECVRDSLERYVQTEFFHRTNAIMNTFLDKLVEDIRVFARRSVMNTTYKPSTYAQDLMTHTQHNIRMSLHTARLEKRIKEHTELREAEGAKPMNPMEQQKRAHDQKWVDENLGPDPYKDVIDAIAIPIAHYDVQCIHVTDMISHCCERELIARIMNETKSKLQQDLNVQDRETCAQLLMEDAQRLADRARLVREKNKLMQALLSLQTLVG